MTRLVRWHEEILVAQSILNARALKCTIVLDPAEVAQLVAPDGKPRTVIAIRLPDRRVSADLNAKSVRKAVAAISEHGPDGVAVIIQGKLVGNSLRACRAGVAAGCGSTTSPPQHRRSSSGCWMLPSRRGRDRPLPSPSQEAFPAHYLGLAPPP